MRGPHSLTHEDARLDRRAPRVFPQMLTFASRHAAGHLQWGGRGRSAVLAWRERVFGLYPDLPLRVRIATAN